MGASWRPGAAALLLALAAALAPAAQAGTAPDPEVSDPAGDQEVDTGTLPVVPGVNDPAFDDVDLRAAWVEEPRVHDCAGAPPGRCSTAHLLVKTSAPWSATGSLSVRFTVAKGPASLPDSVASGQEVALFVNGTAVAGFPNATAATTPDGLRIVLPRLATGGDLLANLTLASSRTDPGLLQDVAEDDQSGRDEAGPGRAYAFARPPVRPALLLEVVSVGGQPGAGPYPATRADAAVGVVLRVTNLGLDTDAWAIGVDASPPLREPPVFIQAFTPIAPGASAETTVPISLEGMDEGTVALTFTATSERGASATATARIALDLPSPPAGPREVKPAGLTFLSTPAEALGFDGSFGSYAELALLALLVLLAILSLFLLLSLGKAAAPVAPAPEAPARPLRAAAAAGPAGVAETVQASPAAAPPPAAAPAPAPLPMEEASPPPAPAPLATAPAGSRVRIEEVRHTPREPEAGQAVTTEVLLRNDGPTARLRVALSVDGRPAAERTVQVAARATKAVELPWTAGPGANRVRIQAFPA